VDSYVSKTQSPFAEGIANGMIRFNNFEPDGPGFPMPGVSIANVGITNVSSVDEDDGILDGVGIGGCLRAVGPRPRFVFNLTADAEGHYPRYFGIVLVTKTTSVFPQERPEEVIGAKDAFGADIFTNYVFPTPTGNLFEFPNYSSHWATFFGFYSESGISQVTFTNAGGLDHLQFGYSIPEPRLLCLSVLLLLNGRRRWRH